jgi:hypothetical protein
MSDLDAAWDSVPKAPTVAPVGPIEQLCRTLRGAIAANPSLWRCIDLEAGTALLAELAKKRVGPASGIPLRAGDGPAAATRASRTCSCSTAARVASSRRADQGDDDDAPARQTE